MILRSWYFYDIESTLRWMFQWLLMLQMRYKHKRAKAWCLDPLRAWTGIRANAQGLESSLSASFQPSLQFGDILTPRKKHKKLIKVEAEMLDEEINNLSGCPKWQVQNKKRGTVLFRLEQNRWWQILYELDWNISFPSSIPTFPMERRIDFVSSSYDHCCDATCSGKIVVFKSWGNEYWKEEKFRKTHS